MNDPVDLNAVRQKRSVEALIQEALAAPPIPNDIDLRGVTLKCDGFVSGSGDACQQGVYLFDISSGVGVVRGALKINPEQWEILKIHVDSMFNAYKNRPKHIDDE